MRISLLLAAALYLLGSTAIAIPLDAKNLRLAAASMSPEFDYRAWARAQLMQKEPLTWAMLQDDPGAMRAAVDASVLAFRQQVDGFDPKQPLVMGRLIRVRGYNEALGGFAIEPAIPRSLTAVRNTPFVRDANLPIAFIVLGSNFDQLSVWPAKEGDRVPKRVYVESEIRLLAYQHNRFFQTAVLKTTVYQSAKKQKVLFEQQESRTPEQVVKTSLLAEGITLDLAPIHNYYLFGERLLEPLYEREMRSADCQVLARIKGHRQYYCNADWPMAGIKLRIGRRYLGGRLVELEFFALEKNDPESVSKIRSQILRDVPPLEDDDVDLRQAATWHDHDTDFFFDPEVLANGTVDKPFLRAKPDAYFKQELSPVQ